MPGPQRILGKESVHDDGDGHKQVAQKVHEGAPEYKFAVEAPRDQNVLE